MAQPNQAPMNLLQQNAIMTKRLRETTPTYTRPLGTFTGALGQTTRIKLQNVGLLTRIFVVASINTTISTATFAQSAKGIDAMFPRVTLSDYDGTLRINASSFHLRMRNSLRSRWPKLAGETLLDSSSFTALVNGTGNTSISNPVFNGAIGSNVQRTFIEVPVCRNFLAGDLTGMINAQTTQGDLYLNIDVGSQSILGTTAQVDDAMAFSATGTIAATAISFEVYQEFYLPQAVAGQSVPIPLYSLASVYALEGFNRTSDNISTGNEKIIPLPNARVVDGIYMSYLNNSQLGGGSPGAITNANDIARIKLLANSGNYICDRSQAMQYLYQREQLGSDISIGAYFLDFVPSPIQTDIYGNVGVVLVPGGSVVTPSVEFTVESTYLKGSALSNIKQTG